MVELAQLASALIGVFEGERLTAYADSGGVWTIGRGHTKDVVPGMVITREQSEQFFEEDQAPLLKTVEGRPLLEAAALVSFGYNCGIGSLQKLLASGEAIPDDRFIRDRKGNVLPGLVARRRLEKLLMLTSRQIGERNAGT
jgi:lysozyme